MTTNAKVPSRAVPRPTSSALAALRAAPPLTTEERLQRIETMGQHINEYVRFMCQVGGLNGSSAEAKERAVTAFYERMVVVESQLARIQEGLRLE